MDINHATNWPGLLEALTIIPYSIGITGDMAWLESWGHELALTAMLLAFATNDAVKDHRRQVTTTQRDAFIEVARMLNQNALHVFGFVKEHTGEWPETEAAHISHAGHALQKAQAISCNVG